MSATRSRKEEIIYRKHRAKRDPKVCEFCVIKPGDVQFVEETHAFKVIRNIFGYSIWDGQRVSDHLMIVPKVHVDSLADLEPKKASEFLNLATKYEKQGYNLYARAPASIIKSVVHQHTHLIKTEGKPKTFILMLRRPFYVRLVQ